MDTEQDFYFQEQMIKNTFTTGKEKVCVEHGVRVHVWQQHVVSVKKDSYYFYYYYLLGLRV